MDDTDPIVLKYYEHTLRLSDLELLQEPFWLNDTLISFYFRFLEKKLFMMYQELLFVSPQLTQCVKMYKEEEMHVFLEPLNCHHRRYIFFALNNNHFERDGGSHWSLLVFDKKMGKCHHYDSRHGSNAADAKMLGERILRYFGLPSKNSVIDEKCLQQANGYDCGVHLLAQCEHLARHIVRGCSITSVPLMEVNAVAVKRKMLYFLIRSLAATQKVYA